MTEILLINPNTSERSLAMMLEIAAPHLPPGVALRGVCAAAGAAMIVSEHELTAAASEVVRLGRAEVHGVSGIPAEAHCISGIIVAAFGDPGIEALRCSAGVPVVGIGEASIIEAANGGRRFGIATTTPGLVRSIEGLVGKLALDRWFTGVRVPVSDPIALAADFARQRQALAQAVADCIELDRAEAVIIGGGPLSDAARAMREQFGALMIEPVPAAIRRMAHLIGMGD